MIVCYINGKKAVPAIQGSIKLTRENPYIKSKDSYTYDITFPMDIAENRMAFGTLNRLDTSRRVRKYDDCRLIVGNTTVICGVGTVTSVSRTELKLQILSGNSSLRYRSEFDQVYIDRIAYPDVPAKYQVICTRKKVMTATIDVDSEVREKGYIGDIQTAVFMPVWDASNNRMANEIIIQEGAPVVDWPQEENITYRMVNRAVQPNLIYVLHKVLEHMGYTVTGDDYDVSPWNELVIASARQTAIIAKALPHWSVSKLLDEFRSLFNATFFFDETAGEVRIVRADSIDTVGTVSYEAEDEFSSNYDEDGLEFLGSSNIKYNLSGHSDDVLEVPDDVLQNFDIREYGSVNELIADFNTMTDQQKLTTLMVDPGGYVYGVEATDDNGRKTGDIDLKRFGVFTKLVRDSSSDNNVELDICPVGFAEHDFKIYTVQYDSIEVRATLPTVDNSEVLPEEGTTEDDEYERPYVTIEDVVEAGMDANQENEEESALMELMWVAGTCQHPVNGTNVLPLRIPACATDYRIGPVYLARSLALSHAGTVPCVGQFHGGALNINARGTVDGNDEQLIRFLCDGIPDPSLVYIFKGKRYLCSKVENNITDDGIDRMKNGYFYEIIS